MLDIEKCLKAVDMLKELDKQGVIGIGYSYVQLDKETFLENFKKYDTEVFRSGELKLWKYELTAYVNGIRFNCLCEDLPKEVTDELDSKIQIAESSEAERPC